LIFNLSTSFLGYRLENYCPVPVNSTACGLDPALSATDTLALRVPVAVGSNVTVMVQLFFGATDVPHVLVCAKSVGFVPVIVMPVIVMAVPPLALLIVMTWPALVVPTVCGPKVKLVGENDAAVLVPETATVYVPLPVMIVSVEARWLMLVGLNVTLIVQLLVPASDDPQLFVSGKSVVFPPEYAMLEMLSAVAVPLVTVTT